MYLDYIYGIQPTRTHHLIWIKNYAKEKKDKFINASCKSPHFVSKKMTGLYDSYIEIPPLFTKEKNLMLTEVD